jgi:hypothetical protein
MSSFEFIAAPPHSDAPGAKTRQKLKIREPARTRNPAVVREESFIFVTV